MFHLSLDFAKVLMHPKPGIGHKHFESASLVMHKQPLTPNEGVRLSCFASIYSTVNLIGSDITYP